MEICRTGAGISVFVSLSELPEGTPRPRSMTARDAAALLRRLLPGDDFHAAVIELFIGGGGVLIFVSNGGESVFYFTFSSFERVLCAAAVCSGGEDSSLIRSGDTYLLILRCAPGAVPPAELCEYGERADALFALFLRERGSIIIEHAAVPYLRRVFHM